MRHRFVAFAVAVLAMTSRTFAQPAEPAPITPTESAAEPVVAPPPVDVVVSPSNPPPTHRQYAYEEPPQLPAHRDTEKSPLLAGALSFGVTATGVALLVLSPDLAPEYDEKGSNDFWRVSIVASGTMLALVGPTSGHIYAGRAWNPGLKWRLIGGGTAAVAFVPAFMFAFSDNTGPATVFGLLAAGGSITYVGAMIREIWTAPGAARRHNERLEEGTSIVLAPIIGREPGLAIGGRF